MSVGCGRIGVKLLPSPSDGPKSDASVNDSGASGVDSGTPGDSSVPSDAMADSGALQDSSTPQDSGTPDACPTVCENPNGTASCESGSCQTRCTTGYSDCDDDPTNGCETNISADPTSCGDCISSCVNDHGAVDDELVQPRAPVSAHELSDPHARQYCAWCERQPTVDCVLDGHDDVEPDDGDLAERGVGPHASRHGCGRRPVRATYLSGGGYTHPRVSSSLFAARAVNPYVASRLAFSLQGTLYSCTQASGPATVTHIDTRIFGCELESGSNCNGSAAVLTRW